MNWLVRLTAKGLLAFALLGTAHADEPKIDGLSSIYVSAPNQDWFKIWSTSTFHDWQVLRLPDLVVLKGDALVATVLADPEGLALLPASHIPIQAESIGLAVRPAGARICSAVLVSGSRSELGIPDFGLSSAGSLRALATYETEVAARLVLAAYDLENSIGLRLVNAESLADNLNDSDVMAFVPLRPGPSPLDPRWPQTLRVLDLSPSLGPIIEEAGLALAKVKLGWSPISRKTHVICDPVMMIYARDGKINVTSFEVARGEQNSPGATPSAPTGFFSRITLSMAHLGNLINAPKMEEKRP